MKNDVRLSGNGFFLLLVSIDSADQDSSSSIRNRHGHHLVILLLLCIICVFPCHRPLSLLFSKSGQGIFNVRNDFSACCAHEGETTTEESATNVDGSTEKQSFTLSRQQVEPWPPDLRSSVLASQPRTPVRSQSVTSQPK